MTKYRAKRTEVDGIMFASKKEAARYQELKMLERAGKIERLELQPKFRIEVCGQFICTYVADFKYYEPGGRTVFSMIVEDVKGFKTPVYRLKKKLVEALHAITIEEV